MRCQNDAISTTQAEVRKLKQHMQLDRLLSSRQHVVIKHFSGNSILAKMNLPSLK